MCAVVVCDGWCVLCGGLACVSGYGLQREEVCGHCGELDALSFG